jgi:rRNA processing protein Gar1
LKRIGRALHISSNKNVILKAENLPKFGDKIVDKNLRSVGTVFDIFGPVSSPYVSVKTNVEESHRLVGHVLYAVPSKPPREKRRKRGND